MAMNRSIELNDGQAMHRVGFGTFRIPDDEVCGLVSEALSCGYRLIDTASYYRNELGIGRAIRNSAIPRGELFIATKVWMDDLGYDRTVQSVHKSLEKLGLDYLDLVLIHWPRPLAIESWKALEELRNEGLVRSIGVSNYNVRLLRELLDVADVTPVLNQVERHPNLQQRDICEFCREHGILVQAWSPIAKGRVTDFTALRSIGRSHGKSPAQVTLRWQIQTGVAVIPKTTNPDRMRENLDVFDFELSPDEMESVAALDAGERLGFDPEYIYAHGYRPGDTPK